MVVILLQGILQLAAQHLVLLSQIQDSLVQQTNLVLVVSAVVFENLALVTPFIDFTISLVEHVTESLNFLREAHDSVLVLDNLLLDASVLHELLLKLEDLRSSLFEFLQLLSNNLIETFDFLSEKHNLAFVFTNANLKQFRLLVESFKIAVFSTFVLNDLAEVSDLLLVLSALLFVDLQVQNSHFQVLALILPFLNFNGSLSDDFIEAINLRSDHDDPVFVLLDASLK